MIRWIRQFFPGLIGIYKNDVQIIRFLKMFEWQIKIHQFRIISNCSLISIRCTPELRHLNTNKN